MGNQERKHHHHEHDHHHDGCGHSGCHCGENLAHAHEEEEGNELPLILVGAAFFAAGLIAEHAFYAGTASLILYVLAYLILGGEIVIKSVRGIMRGDVFGENFLMSIATIGAFVIREYPEAVGVMLFYRVGEWFEDKAVERSRSQIMEAVDMRPEVVHVIRENGERDVAPKDARIGELMCVRPGERIPLDGVVAEGESRIDTSPVTGEPVPVGVGKGTKVLSGCVNVSGLLKIEITNSIQTSMVTKIMETVEHAADNKPVMEKFITRFARFYTPFVVVLAFGTAVIPSLLTGEWYQWIYTALTFLVISCPCALVLSVPLSFFSAIGAGSKLGILFKGGSAIEALGKVNTIVMDKTGTLTKGDFTVRECVASGDMSKRELLGICAQAEQNSTHPIAVSIVSAAREQGIALTPSGEAEEIAGKGLRVMVEGKEVLCGNLALMEEYNVNVSGFLTDAYGTKVWVAVDGVCAGFILIADTIKEDAKAALKALKRRGKKTAMLTGDTRESASHVANELEIDLVYAKLLPENKLECLNEIRRANGRVMFVGDGINDAPVLAGADVGAAMGSGADAAVEAADVVFMNSNVQAIEQAVSLAVKTGGVARENVIFALVVKAVIMILGLLGFANMWWAVFADTGVAMICVLNSVRLLYSKK